MNRWKEVWNKRTDEVTKSDDVFSMYCELKKADGFDVQTNDGYYRDLYAQSTDALDMINKYAGGGTDSVFEVGCGSGVNLYLWQKLYDVKRLGGVDYSESLVKIARQVVAEADVSCVEAGNIDTEVKYDIVMSDSVFQYFPDVSYGMEVLEKMLDRANRVVAVLEVHDLAKKEELMAHRKSMVSDYDERYRGLDKTFYSKDEMIDLAQRNNCEYHIVQPHNKSYWNNEYVFDFYMVKNEQ
jgi:trans-aconitate methyltransferase